MNRPAQVTASEPGPSADVHRPIREAIARLRPGGSHIDDIKSAIADLLYRDLHQAGALRELLDEAHRDRSLSMDAYRSLSTELHRLVTEEVPTDGIPEAPPRSWQRKPKVRESRVGAGSLLGHRYQLEECVAEGPLSDVYRAGDRWRAELTAGSASVAIKVLAPLDDGIVDRDKLRRQALLAQQLAHPNIGRVLSVDRDGDTDFVVVEWLDGESLASLMDRCHPGPVEPATVREMIEATAAALDHALDTGLVHGDLKPANVFVCRDGNIKLLDFGLERGELAAPAMTPDYASCEVLEGRAPEPADDIFSFGVMVYRALTGSRPFGRRTALEAEADGARAERVPGLDDEQWASLEKALAFRRADRNIGAVRLAAALTRKPAVPRAQTDEPVEQPRSWRMAAIGALIVVAVALLATGVQERASDWWRSRDRPDPVVLSPGVEPTLPAPQAEPAVVQRADELPAVSMPQLESLQQTEPTAGNEIARPVADVEGNGVAAEAPSPVTALPGEPADQAVSMPDDPVAEEVAPGLASADSLAIDRGRPEPPGPAADTSIAGIEPAGIEPSGIEPIEPDGIETEPASDSVAALLLPPVSEAVAQGSLTATEPPATEAAADSSVPPAPATVAAAVTAPPPARGGRLGFRDSLYEVDEADGFVKLRLRAPSRHPGIRLRLRAGPGSAEVATDFALSEQIIEIEPGRTNIEVLWPIVNDARDEYLEDVELLLESLTDDYTVTQGDALVIIFDDDGPEMDTADVVQP